MRLIQTNIFLYFFLMILAISGFFFTIMWPHTKGFYTFIVFIAMGGLGVSSYIYYTKKVGKNLVCPVGSNCDVVIRSKYSKFLWIPLEYLGMFYYSIIIIAYTTLIFTNNILPKLFLFSLAIMTLGAFLFSLYLLFVQAFLLRQWCIWCLLSAMLSITIFIVSLVNVNFVVVFLSGVITFIEAINTLGFAIGLGSATVILLLFSIFLRDLDINEEEKRTLTDISGLTWLGLSFIIISQIISYISNAELLRFSSAFIVQTTALFVVAISGAVLMIICAPLLSTIPFDRKLESKRSPIMFIRKILFVTGAVAASSWYFAFAMSYLTTSYKLPILFFVYVLVLATSVSISLIWERRISKSVLPAV